MKHIKTTIIGLLLGCFAFTSYSFLGGGHYFEIAKNIDLYAQLYRELNMSYVDNVEPAKLMRDGIDAMLKSLDPYTNYISEAQIEGYKLKSKAAVGNIGVKLKKKDKEIVILEIYEGLPAHKAKLMVGDVIMAVNGKETTDKTEADVNKILQGQPGSEVILSIKRGNQSSQRFTVTRDKAKAKSVPYHGMLNDKVGYLKLKSFTRNCSNEVVKAIKDLKGEGMESLVFDLRYNGGGLLAEAINMVNIFVNKDQEVVSTKGKTDKWNKSYKTKKEAYDKDIPVVVLINGRSASASEILSGNMQDLDRGVLVGRRSFGKGLVQQTKDIGYNSKLKLTVAKYYLPSGRCVQAIDYSGRYKDDGPVKIPDSLKVAFKTNNGRTVYEGVGVDPDVEIEEKKYANITQSLLKNHLIFDYANQYRTKHASIAEAGKFNFTDRDFEDFTRFLSNKKYEYTTKSEKILEKLKKSAEKEKYVGAIKTTLTEVERKIKQEKAQDLRTFKDEIKYLLKREIVSRYYYQKGEVEVSLSDDDDVKKAIEILQSPTQYQKILSGA